MRRRTGIALVVTAAAVAAAAAGLARLRRAERRWGATDREIGDVLPGDELIPLPRFQATRAIAIAAPTGNVWPWLVQLGQGRAGFYSFDALENAIGLDITSADRIVPEWQHLEAGDDVRLAEGVALRVARLDPGRALVLHGDGLESHAAPGATDAPDAGTASAPPGPPFSFTWAFVVVPDGADRSRLLVRERYDWASRGAGAMVSVVEWLSAVMTIRMLHGIRDRAEREPRPGGGQSAAGSAAAAVGSAGASPARAAPG